MLIKSFNKACTETLIDLSISEGFENACACTITCLIGHIV